MAIKTSHSMMLKNWLLPLILLCSLYGKGQTTETLYLSGTDNENTKTWEFYCTDGRKSGSWSTIEVPAHWEQQGFGTYNYGRDYHTYGKDFEFANEKGIYKYSFTVPEKWKGKKVNIVFEGSMTDTEVKVNGQPAGETHQGAFYMFKYNITELLKFGEENLLEVEVSKMSSNKSVNRAERYADYWIFGGIYRPVFLEALPNQHIYNIGINAKADGSFKTSFATSNISKETKIELSINDAQGNEVFKTTQKLKNSKKPFTLNRKIENVKSWNAEEPNLYTATYSIYSANGKIFEATETFGFRTIEIKKGDGIYVNGNKVKLKGVNRHCFWPETGRSLNATLDLKDALLIKEMNMNAVRASHYPPDRSFLKMCDSLGIYVIDELAGWQNAYDTEVGEKLVEEMVLRDMNHPSIIFWSNGNEGGTNWELDDNFDLYDISKRPVIHCHHKPGNHINGIETDHYVNLAALKEHLDNKELIVMPSEFLHCQDDGGAAAGLHDFWETMWNTPNAGGGFLWDFADEGVVRTDLNNSIDVNRVNAPDGILGPHREKEGSFYAIKKIFSPIKITSNTLKERLEIENRYHFTNLNTCTFKYQIVDFSEPFEKNINTTVVESGMLQAPNIAPTKTGFLDIPLSAEMKVHDAFIITAYDPNGKMVDSWQWRTNSSQDILNDFIPESTSNVSVEETDSTIRFNATNISVSFDKSTGRLLKTDNKRAPELSFANGPVLVSGEAQLIDFKIQAGENFQEVTFNYSGNLKYISWRMHSNGWLQLDYEYSLDGAYPFAGISFNYPESRIIGVKWLGKGPYRVWKNRPQEDLGIYQKLWNNTQTGSTPWQYPEFKGYHADVSWMEFNTVEGNFYMASAQPELFVRLFDFYGITGPTSHPLLPVGDISFLDAIPPVGSKLATGLTTDASVYGEQGTLTQFSKDQPINRSLFFYFGYLKNNE